MIKFRQMVNISVETMGMFFYQNHNKPHKALPVSSTTNIILETSLAFFFLIVVTSCGIIADDVQIPAKRPSASLKNIRFVNSIW